MAHNTQIYIRPMLDPGKIYKLTDDNLAVLPETYAQHEMKVTGDGYVGPYMFGVQCIDPHITDGQLQLWIDSFGYYEANGAFDSGWSTPGESFNMDKHYEWLWFVAFVYYINTGEVEYKYFKINYASVMSRSQSAYTPGNPVELMENGGFENGQTRWIGWHEDLESWIKLSGEAYYSGAISAEFGGKANIFSPKLVYEINKSELPGPGRYAIRLEGYALVADTRVLISLSPSNNDPLLPSEIRDTYIGPQWAEIRAIGLVITQSQWNLWNGATTKYRLTVGLSDTDPSKPPGTALRVFIDDVKFDCEWMTEVYPYTGLYFQRPPLQPEVYPIRIQYDIEGTVSEPLFTRDWILYDGYRGTMMAVRTGCIFYQNRSLWMAFPTQLLVNVYWDGEKWVGDISNYIDPDYIKQIPAVTSNPLLIGIYRILEMSWPYQEFPPPTDPFPHPPPELMLEIKSSPLANVPITQVYCFVLDVNGKVDEVVFGSPPIQTPWNHQVVVGYPVNIKMPTTSGEYTFQKWSTGETLQTLRLKPTIDTTLTAYYVKPAPPVLKHKLTISDNIAPLGVPLEFDGQRVGLTPQTFDVNEGVSVTVTAGGISGYKFTGWSDGNPSKTRQITMGTNDIELQAIYEPIAAVPVGSCPFERLKHFPYLYQILCQIWQRLQTRKSIRQPF